MENVAIIEQVTTIITNAIEDDSNADIDVNLFDRMIARAIVNGVFPLICNDLIHEILETHHSCGTWNDETSNVRECTHLEDVQIIRDYVKRMKG